MPPFRFSRVYYGWWVTLAASVIAFFSYGFGFYGVGVYLSNLVNLHGWSPSITSLAITTYYLSTAAIVIFVGRIIDTRGSRPVLAFGAVVMGLCVAALGFISDVWQLFVVLLFMSFGWASIGATGISGTVAPWFRKRRGTAITIALSGPSAGGMILIPSFVLLIDRFGFQFATSAGAALLVTTVLFLVAAVIRRRPQDMGLLPDGLPQDAQHGPNVSGMSVPETDHTWSRAQVLRSSIFWTFVVPFAAGLSAQVGFIVHQISILQPQIGGTQAAFAVSVTTFSALVGRVVMGTIVDRVDKRLFGVACFTVQAVGFGLVAWGTGSIAVLYIGSSLIGVGIGIVITLPALLTQEEFGTASYGTVFAMVTAVMQVAVAFGPGLVGVIRDLTGSYQTSLWSLAGIEMIAIVVILFGRWSRSRNPTLRRDQESISQQS